MRRGITFKTQDENDLKEPSEINSVDQFLAAVILPPGFEKIDCCVSSRSGYKELRKSTQYTKRIKKHWEEFGSSIMKRPIKPDSNENNPRANIQEISHPLQQSARVFRRVLNEYDEQNFLNEHVWAPSIELGLISDKSNEYVINEKRKKI
jgi:hypothetical protein